MIRLTPREEQVVDLVGPGTRYKAVAKVLRISVHTVREHVRRIASRLPPGPEPRAAVVAFYYRERVTVGVSTAEGD